MRLSLRFLVPLMLALAAFAYASMPLVDTLMLRWFIRDLDIRSSLIASTVEEPLAALIDRNAAGDIASLFNRLLRDERLYAIGLCLPGRKEALATRTFPAEIRCAAVGTSMGAAERLIHTAHGALHLVGPQRRRRRRRDREPRARPRHELHRAPEHRDAALPVLLLRRAGSVRRADHRRHRATVLARLGAGPAGAAARRGHPAPRHRAAARTAPDPARPERADPGSRAAIPAAGRQPAHLGPAGAARDAAERAARRGRHRRLEPRAVHPRARCGWNSGAAAGERTRHRAGARDARVLGHLDRARQRLGGPRDRRPPRPGRGPARRPALPDPAPLDDRGGGARLLRRLCQRGHLAALSQRPRSPDLSRGRLRVLQEDQPALRRRRRRRGQDQEPGGPGPGLSLRAAAADDPRAAAGGDDHHVLAHPVAEPGGVRDLPVRARNCSTAFWAAASSASTRSFTATISSIPSTG